MTNNEYAECVDRLVSTMPSQSSPTNSQQSMKDSAQLNSQTFQEYKAQIDKDREHIAEVGISNALYELGYKIDNLMVQLIKICDRILEDDKPS